MMSLHEAGNDTHLADDELLRFIDGEDDPMRSTWEAHLSECTHCTSEAELLRGDAVVVRSWLERAAFEDALPARHSGRATADPSSDPSVVPIAGRRRRAVWHDMGPLMRIAAVLVLLATPVAAMPALRHWIAAAFTDLRGGDAVPATMHELRSVDAAAIRFVPAAGTFEVQFAAAQQAGSLVLRRTSGSEAVLQITGGAEIEPVISAASLRVRNDAAATASYSLDVPDAVSRVVVRWADGRTTSVDAAGLRTGTEIVLRR